jgi:alpha-L-fucosidase 2
MTSAKERSIWYQEPAEAWIEALPIGNGSLGAMIYGNPIDEQIQLNEETVWAGAKTDRINPDAQSALKEARDHLSAGEYEEAETIIEADLVGDPMRIRPYQSLGEIDIQHPEKVVRNYRRELDLTTGTARVEYETDDGRVIREQFASLEDDVIVFRVRSDGPKPVSIDVSLDREQDARAGTRGDSELVL